MDQLTNMWNRFLESFGEWLPLLLGAIAILLLGWIIASLVRAGVRKILSSLKLNDRVYESHVGDKIHNFSPNIENLLASIAFWLIIIGTISLSVSILGVPALTDFLGAIYSYLPNIFGALLIFFVAIGVTSALIGLIERVMGDTPTGRLVETAVPFIVMGVAIFMILDQLRIAPAIINITYTAIMGAAALGLALAFGLGGRDVAARIMDAAYQKGLESASQVKRDVNVAKRRSQTGSKKVNENLDSNT